MDLIRQSRAQLAEGTSKSRQNALAYAKQARCNFWLLQRVKYLSPDEASFWQATALTVMGSALLPQEGFIAIGSEFNSPEEATAYLERAWQLLQSISTLPQDRAFQRAWTAKRLANAYSRLARYEDALNYFYQALELQNSLPPEQFEVQNHLSVFSNIADIYLDLNADDKARETIDKAIIFIRRSSSISDDRKSLEEAIFLFQRSRTYGDNSSETLQAGLHDLQLASEKLEAEDKIRSLNLALNSRYSRFTAEELLLLFETRSMYIAVLSSIARRYVIMSKIHRDPQLTQRIDSYIKRLEQLEQQIGIKQPERDLMDKILVFQILGSFNSSQGDHDKSLDYHEKALLLASEYNFPTQNLASLAYTGHELFELGRYNDAAKHLNKALDLAHERGDNRTQIHVYKTLSEIEQKRGNLTLALERIRSSVHLVESLRTNIFTTDERTSLFTNFQDVYTAYIDLLMQLNQQNPSSNKYAEEAFRVSETTRARTFIELLAEANVDSRRSASPELLRNEQQLKAKIQQLYYDQTEYFCYSLHQFSVHDSSWITRRNSNFEQEISSLKNKLSTVQYQILNNNSAFAAISQPNTVKTITADEVQQTILDPDSVLLQYSLGEERSYLWVVTQTGITSYTLPDRAKIEQAATDFRDNILLVQGNTAADINAVGNALREQILPADAVKQLRGKRLVIAADGILHFIPFAALPNPDASIAGKYIPLLKAHEIVNVPSISALAEQRKQHRPNAPKTLAILADPVFSDRDPRVPQRASRSARSVTLSANASTASSTPLSQQLEQSQSQRLLEDCSLNAQSLDRLPETATTAAKILNLLPDAQKTVQRLGFDANKNWISDPQQSKLKDYKMLLLATHGCVSSNNPQLSALFLSQVDANGQAISGALRLGDLFNLDLAAELVVLSACQTGLGKQLRGEGIIGLNRGLMYAGAKRVVGSLWSVSAEQGTPELIEKFFTAMLRPKQPLAPAAALREAQIQVWEKHPDPYFWAAFTLQGEWRNEN